MRVRLVEEEGLEVEGPAKRLSKAADPLELASLPPDVTGAAGREAVSLRLISSWSRRGRRWGDLETRKISSVRL